MFVLKLYFLLWLVYASLEFKLVVCLFSFFLCLILLISYLFTVLFLCFKQFFFASLISVYQSICYFQLFSTFSVLLLTLIFCNHIHLCFKVFLFCLRFVVAHFSADGFKPQLEICRQH